MSMVCSLHSQYPLASTCVQYIAGQNIVPPKSACSDCKSYSDHVFSFLAPRENESQPEVCSKLYVQLLCSYLLSIYSI